jgi:RHS repeat-associated protein
MKISAFSPQLIIALFIVVIAAVPSRIVAQSFPTTGLKDWSDTMIETPDTSMLTAPDDPIFSTQEPNPDEVNITPDPNYTPPDAPYSPDLPETGSTYEGPVGVTGIFNGNITTGCSYDPLSHSAHRVIDDIVVPGSVGKYPLKMTRYYNSRQQYYATPGSIGLSPGWSYEYAWLLWTAGNKVVSPHGNVLDFYCGPPVGVSEGWDDGNQSAHPAGGTWRLSDGGKVVLSAGRATDIYDPNGLRTRIAYNTSGPQIGQRVKVTEPGGRCLWFIYGTQNQGTTQGIPWGDGTWLLTRVEAYDSDGYPGSPTHPNGHLIDWVNYAYQAYDPVDPLNPGRRQQKMLVRVDYPNSSNNLADNTHAHYDYRTDNVHEGGVTHKTYPLLKRADDVRYNGPMRTIVYLYQNTYSHGFIVAEKAPNIPVSAITPDGPDTFTETRGDGPTRSFTYTHMSHCTGGPPECITCTDYENNNSWPASAPQQMLKSYTDFQDHTTRLDYDNHWYISSVKDANNNTTYYEHNAGLGAITKITHPGDGSYIQYGYQPETGALGGHYITSIRDENNHTTTITRDGGNHRITWIEYPIDGNPPSHEEFSDFDIFGHPRTHRLRNSAYERFEYDGRGLLTDKYNPKQTGVPGGNDPHTHYDYYTAADGKPGWTDRVKKMTGPAPNWSLSEQAWETYEYDKKSDGTACAGRGLITKITYPRPDPNSPEPYKAFKYDQWGNKVSEWNELGERTDYVYDGYNRIKSVTRANETTTYTYKPTNGNGNSPYLHTTNSPDTIMAPTGILTSNVYDKNFRKTSTAVAGAPPTQFAYDDVGNLRFVTDPNGHTTETDYDPRNRKWHVWDALRQQTTFTYDGASNVIYITRPDTSVEHKGYDATNRVIWDIVPYKSDPVLNLVTSFEYNPSGTIHKVTLSSSGGTDPNPDHWTTFDYDASDRRKTMTYQNNQTQSWAYDDAGNMESRTTVNGQTLLFGYDNRNRKYGESWWDPNAAWRYFGLDAASRLRRATNGIGLWFSNFISDVHRAYDTAGRLYWDSQTILDQPNGPGLSVKDVRYEYDMQNRGTDGNPTRMYVPGANYDYTFSYDEMGRFEIITPTSDPNHNRWFQYYYDAASNETERFNWRNHVAQNYTPDSLNRISYLEVKNTDTGGILASETYTHDGMNRLRTVTREDNKQDQFYYYLDGELYVAFYGVTGANGADTGASPPAEDPTKEKTVEDFLSLPDGTEPDYTQTYNRAVTYLYDKAGSRTWVADTGPNGNKAYTPNNINQYINTVGVDPISNSPEHQVASYKNVSYTYQKDEHLMSVSSVNPNNSYQLAYDALGRCVKRTVNGVIKYYIYDGERPILEYSAAGALIGQNTYGKGMDEILQRWDATILAPNPRTFYFQQDHEGSVIYLTYNPPTGTDVRLEKYRYDVFGAPTILAPGGAGRQASIVSNRFLFTGREWSSMFGFYEYRNRAYHPLLGRFMSEDPKLFVRSAGLGKAPGDWSFATHPDEAEFNLFRYCDNDPIDFTDPMGEAVFGLYDTYAEYFGDVGHVFIGEVKGAGNILSLGLYQPSYTNINQRLGGYVGQGLAVAGLAAATKAGPKPAAAEGAAPKAGLGSPFKGKSPEQIDSMMKGKGLEPRGPDPKSGKGGYVNPETGRSYHIDSKNRYGEPAHVDVSRPKGYNGQLDKKKFPIDELPPKQSQ